MISRIQITIEPEYYGGMPTRIHLRTNVNGKEYNVLKFIPAEYDFNSVFDVLMDEIRLNVLEIVRREKSSSSKVKQDGT